MTSLPRITVITVCRNSGVTLDRALRSVLDQRYPNLEYIVIDGGSTDDSVAVIKRHAAELHAWVSEPDGGISEAFNKGLALATGDLIGFLNADDTYAADALQHVAESYDSEHPKILHGMLRYRRGGQALAVFTGDHTRLHREMTLNHMATFVPQTYFTQWGGFRTDYRYAMDYQLLLRFARQGAVFQHVPRVLATMELDGASDRHWTRAYREVARAKVETGTSKLSAYAYLAFMLVRGGVGRAADALRLASLRQLYRTYIARISPASSAASNHR